MSLNRSSNVSAERCLCPTISHLLFCGFSTSLLNGLKLNCCSAAYMRPPYSCDLALLRQLFTILYHVAKYFVLSWPVLILSRSRRRRATLSFSAVRHCRGSSLPLTCPHITLFQMSLRRRLQPRPLTQYLVGRPLKFCTACAHP